jgi:hypothetical protein
MKITLKTEKDFEIKTLRVVAEVRYWEDATLNGKDDEEGNMPCRKDIHWCPDIDIETGKILNWVTGNVAKLHYKVCDRCHWVVLDKNNEIVLQSIDDYVPKTLCPDGNGYGDYIKMTINSEGYIQNWKFNINDFTENDNDD